MPPRRSGRASASGTNGSGLPGQADAPSIPIPPNGVGLASDAPVPQTSMLHALSHIPPQPMGPPLPHPNENGLDTDDRMTPLPDETPAEPVKLVVPAANGAMGKKGKANAVPVINQEAEGEKNDLIPPPAAKATSGAAGQESSTGRRRGKRISYAEDAAHEDEDVEHETTTPKRTKSKKVVKDEESEADPSELSELSELDEKPVTTPKKRAKKRKPEVDENGDAIEDTSTPAKVRKPTPKKSRLAVKNEPEFDEDGNEIIKKKRKPKVYAKIEYDIPDVERKTTTFKGQSFRTRL